MGVVLRAVPVGKIGVPGEIDGDVDGVTSVDRNSG